MKAKEKEEEEKRWTGSHLEYTGFSGGSSTDLVASGVQGITWIARIDG